MSLKVPISAVHVVSVTHTHTRTHHILFARPQVLSSNGDFRSWITLAGRDAADNRRVSHAWTASPVYAPWLVNIDFQLEHTMGGALINRGKVWGERNENLRARNASQESQGEDGR